MNNHSVAYSRAPQILQLLYEYGPLSVKGLETILRPRISKRRLQEALLRLYEKGLIIRRFEASPFSRQYYELSQSARMRDEINRLTGIPTDRLLQPYFRSQELLHSEECAFWASYLKSTFPEADVVRDFRIKNHKEICDTLLMEKDNMEILPDIVLYFPKNFGSHSVTIPFEVELSRKSDIRLIRKLSKYCTATLADGVVYLCHKNTVVDTIRSIYEKSVTAKSHRINHYRNLFLLFGNRSFDANTLEPKLFSVNSEAVSLKAWVQALRGIQNTKRRDLKLTTPA